MATWITRIPGNSLVMLPTVVYIMTHGFLMFRRICSTACSMAGTLQLGHALCDLAALSIFLPGCVAAICCLGWNAWGVMESRPPVTCPRSLVEAFGLSESTVGQRTPQIRREGEEQLGRELMDWFRGTFTGHPGLPHISSGKCMKKHGLPWIWDPSTNPLREGLQQIASLLGFGSIPAR